MILSASSQALAETEKSLSKAQRALEASVQKYRGNIDDIHSRLTA